jgi:hypothetical protein
MIDQLMLERFLILRQWLRDAAGACTWCASRIAMVLVDKEHSAMEPVPSWGCARRDICYDNARIFMPSKPHPGETMLEKGATDCPTCHTRAMIVKLASSIDAKVIRTVIVCQACRRQDLGDRNGK